MEEKQGMEFWGEFNDPERRNYFKPLLKAYMKENNVELGALQNLLPELKAVINKPNAPYELQKEDVSVFVIHEEVDG